MLEVHFELAYQSSLGLIDGVPVAFALTGGETPEVGLTAFFLAGSISAEMLAMLARLVNMVDLH